MNKAPTNTAAKQAPSTTQNKTVVNTAKSSTVNTASKISVNSTVAKNTSSVTAKPANNTTKASNIKPSNSTSTKTSTTSAVKSTAPKSNTKISANIKAPAPIAQKKPDAPQQIQQVKNEPEVKKMNVEHIKLQQLFNKIEEYRDKNRSLLIIDKLEANDSFTFFKYKGYIADISEYLINEQTNIQNREKSVESARKQVVVSLKVGGTLVFFVDSMLVDLQNFFAQAQFFSPSELFVPEEAQKESYYVKKLLKEEENVDGFGNKGGYYPKKEFAAVILSKSNDLEPEDLIKKLNMPAELFDCIIIS